MRLFLMLVGIAISAGALLFWIWLNAMAGSWNTSNAKPATQWLTGEALLYFWLPFALGAAIAFIGWKRP
jgi:hypothetical protein